MQNKFPSLEREQETDENFSFLLFDLSQPNLGLLNCINITILIIEFIKSNVKMEKA